MSNFLDKLKIHKFKILGGVIGIFVFVEAVFGAYKLGQRKAQVFPTPVAVATPTPDLYTEASRSATANWKSYTNTKYGYSIKYPLLKYPPSGLSFAPKEHETTDNAVLSYVGFGFPDFEEPLIAVAVTNRSFGEEIKLLRQIISVESEVEITVDAVKGVKLYGKIKGEIRHVFWIALPKGNYTYVVSTPGYNIKDAFSTFNLVLSTFKFLE